MDDLEKKEEVLPTEPEGRPFWQVQVEYSNHTVRNISSYEDYPPEHPEELYFSYWIFLNQKMKIFDLLT